MIESRHAIVLKKLLATRRQELLEALVTSGATEIGEYKRLIGQIQGLDDAVKLSDDADFEINGGS